nr:MAG TPA: hypothetical protein [Caudoviricetes sp.]
MIPISISYRLYSKLRGMDACIGKTYIIVFLNYTAHYHLPLFSILTLRYSVLRTISSFTLAIAWSMS